MAEFDHMPNGAEVHPASDSIANPGRWITVNQWPISTPGQTFSAVHTCLIPSGPFRGCVLVWDGNHTLIGTRAYQPWAIVDPYWPLPNPFVPGGGTGYRFHNATLQMPATTVSGGLQVVGEGELFCAGQRWTSDGRLFVAGGTRVYPLSSTPSLPPTNTGTIAWEGASLVYQWDATATSGNPFGTWYRMANLEAERWYPTVAPEGTLDDRLLILGGTDRNGLAMIEVNTYESYRVNFGVFPPALMVVEQKPGNPPPPPTARQYQGTIVNAPWPTPGQHAGFTDYPRAHALGVLDPISTGQAPRFFVSGFHGQGIRWAHDRDFNPTYAFDAGLEVTQSSVPYSTNVLYPAGPGAIGTRVVRIGGGRITATTAAVTGRVESVVAGAPPSFWSSGTPTDIPDMLTPRLFHNVVILPTGQLFAVGGGNAGGAYNYEPELLRDGTYWKHMAPHNSPRGYHNCALLLPDARVLICGGEGRTSDYEIWEPEYLQVAPQNRPANVALVNAQTLVPISQTLLSGVTYGQLCIASWSNALPAGVEVNQAVLMAPEAVTHHDDGGQRCVRLVVSYDGDVVTPTSVRVSMPATMRHAPPGWYMLFLLTNQDCPSHAYWVNLR